jgi:hypothetical protein
MSRRIDEIDEVVLVLAHVEERDGAALHRDAAFLETNVTKFLLDECI